MARTLNYRLIKAGMRKAGQVPSDATETIELIAWLSAAGYGKGCLPSLKNYIYFRYPDKQPNGGYQRRGRSYRVNERERLAKGLGIAYPGKTTSPRKAAQRKARTDNYSILHALGRKNRQADEKAARSLQERLRMFKRSSGPNITKLIRESCGIMSATTSLDDLGILRVITWGGRIVCIKLPEDARWKRYSEPCLPNIGVVPYPLP